MITSRITSPLFVQAGIVLYRAGALEKAGALKTSLVLNKTDKFAACIPASNLPGNMKSRHAEEEVLKDIQRHLQKRYAGKNSKIRRNVPIHLFVVRFSKLGQLGNSRPCHHCIFLLARMCKHFNIKSVTYSTEDGKFKTESLKDLVKSRKIDS